MSHEAANTLLIGGSFFGYALHLVGAMEKVGRRVIWFDDRPETDATSKALLRISPRLISGRISGHVDRIIAAARNSGIRDVLIIKGEGLSPASIRLLRAALPDARFVLYFWDSYRNMPSDSPAKVDVCDKAFTFDPDDAEADSRLHYRPLFFTDDCLVPPGSIIDIDLLWVGTMHSDRYRIIERLQYGLESDLCFHRYQYFAAPFLYKARRLFDTTYWGTRPDQFEFSPLDRGQLRNLISRSRALLDIERPVQCGLTIRTIETLGAARKLVTTNTRVRNSDFFDAQNICVIDRKEPHIPHEFWRTPYRPPPAAVVDRYSISSWVEEVLPRADAGSMAKP